VALTEAGSALYRTARHTLREVQNGIDAARRAARGESGSLTIGFAGSVLLTALAKSIRQFREARPDVDVRLREMPTGTQVDALAAGTIDVGLAREMAPRDGIVVEPLLSERLIIALPQDHPLVGSDPIVLKRLRDQPFILFPRASTPGLYDQIVGMCEHAGFTPRVVQEAVEWLSIVSLVAAGGGLSIVPESFRGVRWQGVEYRPTRPRAPLTTIHLCYRSGIKSAIIDAFIAMVRPR